jgi:DNA-binding transcriptional regulator YhcF (GntR family)
MISRYHRAGGHLELEGLAEGRPGVGTFVLRTLAGPALASHAALRRDLEAWLRRAHTAGLEREDIVALVETTLRASFLDGRRDIA